MVNADFSLADLRGATLSFGELSGVNFFGADLTDAYIEACDLTGADFSNSQLHRTTLTMMNCVDTKFNFADFGGTANVVDCNFEKCGFKGALFNDLDMNDILFDR